MCKCGLNINWASQFWCKLSFIWRFASHSFKLSIRLKQTYLRSWIGESGGDMSLTQYANGHFLPSSSFYTTNEPESPFSIKASIPSSTFTMYAFLTTSLPRFLWIKLICSSMPFLGPVLKPILKTSEWTFFAFFWPSHLFGVKRTPRENICACAGKQ